MFNKYWDRINLDGWPEWTLIRLKSVVQNAYTAGRKSRSKKILQLRDEVWRLKDKYEPVVCETCKGAGTVGGFVEFDGGGSFVPHKCPDCDAPPPEVRI